MSLATLKIFSALLVKFELGAISLRSVEFIRTVKLLTVRQEEFTVRKLHVISDNENIFDFAGQVREGFKVFTVRKVVNGPSRRVYGSEFACQLATLKIFSALLVKFERGAISLLSVRTVRPISHWTPLQLNQESRKLSVANDMQLTDRKLFLTNR